MSTVYVLYQISTLDCANVNDIEDNVCEKLKINGAVEILKVYRDVRLAIQDINNEALIQRDENWVYEVTGDNTNIVIATFYYCGEKQYSLVLKEMETI